MPRKLPPRTPILPLKRMRMKLFSRNSVFPPRCLAVPTIFSALLFHFLSLSITRMRLLYAQMALLYARMRPLTARMALPTVQMGLLCTQMRLLYIRRGVLCVRMGVPGTRIALLDARMALVRVSLAMVCGYLQLNLRLCLTNFSFISIVRTSFVP